MFGLSISDLSRILQNSVLTQAFVSVSRIPRSSGTHCGPVRDDPGMDTDMRGRIRRANDDTYAAWNAHDADAVAAVFAPDAEIVDITSGSVTRGRDAIRATAVERFTAFPDFSLEKVFLIIEAGGSGRGANADRWIMRGTHLGEFMGLAPTGNTVEVQGATFSEFDGDGLVVRDTHYIDLGALMRQLGLT